MSSVIRASTPQNQSLLLFLESTAEHQHTLVVHIVPGTRQSEWEFATEGEGEREVKKERKKEAQNTHLAINVTFRSALLLAT